MYVRYNLYRTGDHSNEVFNAEMIEFVLENDDHLVMIDDIMTGMLTQHIQDLEEIKKYGIGYVGKMEIVNIEITDKDYINLTEKQFKHYMSTINPKIPIIWNRQSNNISEEEKSVKS